MRCFAAACHGLSPAFQHKKKICDSRLLVAYISTFLVRLSWVCIPVGPS